MRIFAGISLPEYITERITWIFHGIPDARWIRPENLHITLKFIEELSQDSVDQVGEILQEIEFHSFEISLRGVFLLEPPTGSVLCGGLKETPGVLTEIHKKINSGFRKLNIPADTHKFLPHTTLARLKNPNTSRVHEYLKEYRTFETVPFTVNEFHLYQNELQSGGAVYSILRTYPAR